MHSTSAAGRDMRRNMILLTAFLVMLGAAFAAMAGTTLDRVRKTGKLNLGYVSEVRPYSFKNEAGSPDGYGIDLCKQIVENAKADLGSSLSVNFVVIPVGEGIRAVAQGKVDLMCTPTVPTTANRKEASFTTPVFASGIGALVRSDVPAKLKDILSGKTPRTGPVWRANADQVLQRSTLAVMSGSRSEKELLEGLNRLKLSTKIISVDDYAAGVASVTTQRADAFFGERAMLLEAARQHKGAVKLQVLDRYFTHEVGALALARGDEDFRLVIDQALGKVLYSSDFGNLYAKWFGPLSDTALTLYRLNALRD